MINLHEELALARREFLVTFKCLPDCQEKALAATDAPYRRFYETQVHVDKISLEFWAGQITELEKALSQEKGVTDAATPLEFPQSKIPQVKTGT